MRAAVALAALAALALPSLAHGGVARPNPVLVSPTVDYVAPIPAASGGAGQLEPLDPAVIPQALADHAYLTYRTRSDLGGFLPAPVGQLALSSGGRAVVGASSHQSQIPQFAQAGSGNVQSFAFVGGGAPPPPDQGTSPVPGLGTPPPVVPPANTNTVPPPNQGFGGLPTGGTTTTAPTTTGRGGGTTTTPGTTTTSGGGGGGTTTTTPTTTTTTTTTAPTTTTTTTTTTTAPPGGGGGSGLAGSSCGTVGLGIDVDRAQCRIYAVNMAPGDAAAEHVTVTNESDQAFTLSLKASGTQNRLWQDLQLGVWPLDTAAPSPLPSLLLWTTQYNELTTLQPGASVTYEIELYLPSTAGNADQGLAAVIDFDWKATA